MLVTALHEPVVVGLLAFPRQEVEAMFVTTAFVHLHRIFHDVAVVVLCQFAQQWGVGVGLDPVVGIDEGDPLAARCGDAGVSRSRQPAVRAVQDNDARVGCRQLVAHRRTGIGRTVVHQHHLHLLHLLAKHTLDTAPQRCLDPIDGNDDRQLHVHTLLPLPAANLGNIFHKVQRKHTFFRPDIGFMCVFP